MTPNHAGVPRLLVCSQQMVLSSPQTGQNGNEAALCEWRLGSGETAHGEVGLSMCSTVQGWLPGLLWGCGIPGAVPCCQGCSVDR